jgi:ATP-binding cassette, subfamily B, bacterial MsbA
MWGRIVSEGYAPRCKLNRLPEIALRSNEGNDASTRGGKPPLRRLLEYGWRHAGLLSVSFACMAVLGATTAAYAYLMGPALRFLISGASDGLGPAGRFFPAITGIGRSHAVWSFPLLIVAIGAIKGLAYLGQFYGMGSFGQRVAADLRGELFAKLCRLSPVQLSKRLSGDLLSRFSSDVAAVELAATYAVASYVRDGLQIASLIVVAFILDWRSTVAVLVMVPLAAAPVSRITQAFLRRTQEAQSRLGQIAGEVKETLGAVKPIQSFNGQEAALDYFGQEQTHYRTSVVRAAWARSSVPALMEVLAALAISGTLGYAASRQSLPAENLVSLIAAIALIYQPIKDLGRVSQFGVQAVVSGARIFSILDTVESVLDRSNARELSQFREAIVFDRVDYCYGDRPALTGLSLTIPSGKTIALVGPSGGGKSTVVSMLLRFDRPSGGAITVDGIDIEQLTTESIRQKFGLVTQEPMLFSESVLENIRIARPAASIEEVIEAAQIADADGFIRALPKGYDTQVGERGVTLSGGQRQRICIARAVLSKAPILLFDEATSSLDPSSEREVQQALSRVLPGRTAVVIAHRLWTVTEADCIYVLDRGRVVERGNHRELLSLGGLYARLWRLQQDAQSNRSRVA